MDQDHTAQHLHHHDANVLLCPAEAGAGEEEGLHVGASAASAARFATPWGSSAGCVGELGLTLPGSLSPMPGARGSTGVGACRELSEWVLGPPL